MWNVVSQKIQHSMNVSMANRHPIAGQSRCSIFQSRCSNQTRPYIIYDVGFRTTPKVPLFSFPHDLQGITTRDLGHVVLYESEIRNNRLIDCFIVHRHGVAPGCARHGKCRWTWPWSGERMVNWGPHSKVAKLRLITCILPGQPQMGVKQPVSTRYFWTNAAR